MIHICICDDQADYMEILSYKISKCMHEIFKMECDITCLETLDSFNSYISQHKIDIAFLDIMVNDSNAMDWSIENIKQKNIQLIFMTAFPQSAYNISESNCCYYLVKSRITDESLFKALQRALQNTTLKSANLTIVKADKKNVIINLADLMYLESYKNNIIMHFKDGSTVNTYSTLKEYSARLPVNFIRCHKCYTVNMNYIKEYLRYKFIIFSGEDIPIPPKKYSEIIKIYQSYVNNL